MVLGRSSKHGGARLMRVQGPCLVGFPLLLSACHGQGNGSQPSDSVVSHQSEAPRAKPDADRELKAVSDRDKLPGEVAPNAVTAAQARTSNPAKNQPEMSSRSERTPQGNASPMCAEGGAPNSPEELQQLRDSGQVSVRTVMLNDADTRARLRSACVFAMTMEPSYAVVLARHGALDAAGLTHRPPVESDYKRRRVTIEVNDAEQVAVVQQLLGDLWSVTKVPGDAEGRGTDYEIGWLRDRNFKVVIRSE